MTYRKTLKLTAFNAVVTSSLFQLAIYPLSARRVSCDLPLPPLTKVIWDLLICAVFVEIFFYYNHRYCREMTSVPLISAHPPPSPCRFFHHPKLYKLVHKTHHEWTAPVGVASIYCHPLEHAMVNLLPVVVGPLVAGSHLSVAWLWYEGDTVLVHGTSPKEDNLSRDSTITYSQFLNFGVFPSVGLH